MFVIMVSSIQYRALAEKAVDAYYILEHIYNPMSLMVIIQVLLNLLERKEIRVICGSSY